MGYREQREEKLKLREKLAIDFLEQCKREGFSVRETNETIKRMQTILEYYTELRDGFVSPQVDTLPAKTHKPD